MRSELVSIQWKLYGVIVRRRGDNLVIEPLTDLILSEGFEFRIMRPSGGDRVSHVANGHILTAYRFGVSGDSLIFRSFDYLNSKNRL